MYTAVTAIQKSDLLISLGARFDDRVTGRSHLRRRAKVIHVDIDRAEFNKVRQADVAIQSNVAAVLTAFDAARATRQPRRVVETSMMRDQYRWSTTNDG